MTTQATPSGGRYAEAGVDIDAGHELVSHIGPLANATRRTGWMGALGGFGGLFDLAACGFKDPVLVATTDGVGTKVLLAKDNKSDAQLWSLTKQDNGSYAIEPKHTTGMGLDPSRRLIGS